MATRTKKPTQKKYFTAQQANAALPLVRVIVRDIVALAQLLQDRRERLDRLYPEPEVADLSEEHREELREMRRQIDLDREQMHQYIQELLELGVELKDPLLGLVDFPCLQEDREVCLCWMYGEASVQHWHERDAGFAGRKRLKAPGHE